MGRLRFQGSQPRGGTNMFQRLLIGIALVGIASTEVLAQTCTTENFCPIPAPIVGAGLPGLLACGAAAFAWYRSRRKKQ